jgi:hypothetical protein
MLPLWGVQSSSICFSGPEIPVYFPPLRSGGLGAMVNSNFTEANAMLAEMAAKTDGTKAAERIAPRQRMALGQDGNQGQSR